MTGDYFTGGEGEGGTENTSSLASSEIIQSNQANIKNFISKKGLASHCKAKTTFTFHFSIINA